MKEQNKCKDCIFFVTENYHGNSWHDCNLDPKPLRINYDKVACRYFESRVEESHE